MNENEYGEMYERESRYWWYVARRHLLRRLLEDHAPASPRPTIVDVGCGTGINQRELESTGTWIGIDSSKAALSFSRLRGAERLIHSRLESLPVASDSVDVVTALDVLEHIKDDGRAIDEMYRILKANGTIIVIVPAYNFLWSEHDEALHHYRRYLASGIRKKLTAGGFEVRRVSYFIMSLFLPILLIRFWQSVFKKDAYPKTSHIDLPTWINSLLIRLLRLESSLLRRINFPFGVSVICVARKPCSVEV